MLSNILAKLRTKQTEKTRGLKHVPRGVGLDHHPTGEDPLADIPRYPPYDTGIPVKPVEQIVASQRELIGRIFRTAGVSREEYNTQYEPVISNLARFVHLLPATSTSHHRGAGGLFRMSLELGLHALQGANGAVFPSGGVEQRYFLNPKWTLGTFLAGICCQLYRTVNNMVVVDRENNQWAPLLAPLTVWAKDVRSDVYFIRWTEDRNQSNTQASSAYLVNHIVPPAVLQFLSSDNNQVIPMMTAAITGTTIGAGDNPVTRIIAPLITRVIEEDLKLSPMNYGHLSLGIHIEPHLIDAMRRLVRNGWTWNNRNGKLWIGDEGVFIIWPEAAKDVVNLLVHDNFAGVPRDRETLADMLTKEGVFERGPGESKYWSITHPETSQVIDEVAKLKHREIIFPQGFDFAPFAGVKLMLEMPKPRQEEQVSKQESKPTKPRKEPQREQIDPETGEIAEERKAERRGQGSHPRNEQQEQSARNEQRNNRAEAVEPEKDQVRQLSFDENSAAEKGGSDPADKLLSVVKKESAWLLREILQHSRSGKLIGSIASFPFGLGISHDELTAHGQPVMDLMEDMAGRNWLWIDKAKPQKKLHLLEHGGKQLRFLVIKPDVAVALGFDWKSD